MGCQPKLEIFKMAKVNTSKYTPAMETAIRDAAPLNAEIAARLAAEFGNGITAKSVTAKAIRMNVAYNRKVAVSKNGAPVEKKESIVDEISGIVNANLDGLEKAPKGALQTLRDFLVANQDEEDESE
jgi:hypothetical protein